MPKDNVIILATYNIRVPCDSPPNDWDSRRDRVRWMINKHHFDIFGVQEAPKKQIDDIIEGTSFAKVGGGRDDFKDKGEHSCIFYDTRRFECLGGGTFGLSEKPDVPGCRSWGAACTRIASWGKFRDRKSGKLFCHYNTHLDHVSELARVNGIKMVVAHASKNCGQIPLVLSGDFNAYPGSETYKIASRLLRDSAVISKTAHKGPSRTFHNWGRRTRNGRSTSSSSPMTSQSSRMSRMAPGRRVVTPQTTIPYSSRRRFPHRAERASIRNRSGRRLRRPFAVLPCCLV